MVARRRPSRRPALWAAWAAEPAAEIRIGLRGMVVVVAVGILVAPHPVEILHRRPVGLGGAVDRVAVEGVGDRAAKASAMSMAAAGLAVMSRNGTLAAASRGAASACSAAVSSA